MSEEYILCNWAIETINRKTKNGIEFDLKRRGMFCENTNTGTVPLTGKTERELFEDYL